MFLSFTLMPVSDLIKNDIHVDANFVLHIEVQEVCMFFILIQFALHLKETKVKDVIYIYIYNHWPPFHFLLFPAFKHVCDIECNTSL